MSRFQYRTILVGVDFSEPSRGALARALHLAELCGARLEVVTVVEKVQPAVPFSRQNRQKVEQIRREQRDEAQKRLDRLVPRRPRATVRTRVLSGAAHDQILAQAKRVRADLIVLANRGHGVLEELLIGSTADRVLRKAGIPVLLVPS